VSKGGTIKVWDATPSPNHPAGERPRGLEAGHFARFCRGVESRPSVAKPRRRPGLGLPGRPVRRVKPADAPMLIRSRRRGQALSPTSRSPDGSSPGRAGT
jgi:hypothetical protein